MTTTHIFPSDDWADAYRDALNENPAYAEAGKDWTHGAVAMVVKADAALGIDTDMAVLLDVDSGRCRAASYLDGDAAREQGAFVLEGTYARWATLIKQGDDPIKTLMQGKLKMTKGHLPTLIRYVESSKQLLASAQNVATEYREP